MTAAAPVPTESTRRGLRIPGFAQLQRLGKSLMLPIAVLPAAGILLRLGQDDLLGQYDAPVIGPFFDAMSAAGGAIFANLPLLFAVGVAIGFARKADGSTALSAVAGYLVVDEVFTTMSPIVLAGETTAGRPGADQLQRLRRHHRRRAHRVALRPLPHHPAAGLPRILRRETVRPDRGLAGVPLPRVRPRATSIPVFDVGLTDIAEFIGGSGAIGAFVYGFVNRMLIPLGLHHIVNAYIWFLYGDFASNGTTYNGELTRFANGRPRGRPPDLGLLPDPDVRSARCGAGHDPHRSPRDRRSWPSASSPPPA